MSSTDGNVLLSMGGDARRNDDKAITGVTAALAVGSTFQNALLFMGFLFAEPNVGRHVGRRIWRTTADKRH
jgi:hypothetical protein